MFLAYWMFSIQSLKFIRIRETNFTTIKNYSILVRFRTKTRVMNAPKEYRDVSLCSGIRQMYQVSEIT